MDLKRIIFKKINKVKFYLKNLTNQKLTNLILLIILLLRLPSIVIVPNFYFTTHSFASFLILIFFARIIFSSKIKSLAKSNSVLMLLMSLHLLSLSLSFINVLNTETYLKIYKNYLVSFLLFIIVVFFFKKRDIRKIIKILLLGTTINLFFEIFIYFNPNIFYYYISNFIHPQGDAFINYQLSRLRFFGDFFDEIFTPIIIFLFLEKKDEIKKYIYLITLMAIIFITIASNWRTKQIILFFSLLCSFRYFLTSKNYLKKIKMFFLLVSCIIIFYFSHVLTLNLINQNSITRLVDPSVQDRLSIESRFKMFWEAIEIGKKYPIIGVGLGNFYDYWQTFNKINTNYLTSMTKKIILIDHSHNIFTNLFAETGALGLLTYLILLIYFISFDIKILRRKKPPQAVVVFSFWSLFLFSLFNPSTGLYYLSLFWILRAMINLH